MRILLIDGDILCRRAAHGAAARASDEASEVATAVRRVEDAVARLRERLRGDRLLAALGSGASFRSSIEPSYKAARRLRRPPQSLEAARRRLGELIETRSAPGLEADDLLGVWATAPDLSFAAAAAADERGSRRDGPRILVSSDKDLLSIPGLHGRESGRVWRVAPDEAEARHLAQTLIGDGSDGYRGCPGVGPKRAARLLGQVEPDPWRTVLGAFRDAGLGPEAALTQARLARILRHGEVDQDEMKPILWTPRQVRGFGPEIARRAIAPFLPTTSRTARRRTH